VSGPGRRFWSVLVALSLPSISRRRARGPSHPRGPLGQLASAFLKMSQNIAPTDYDNARRGSTFTRRLGIAIDGSLRGSTPPCRPSHRAVFKQRKNPRTAATATGSATGPRRAPTRAALETLASLVAAPLNTAGTTTMLTPARVSAGRRSGRGVRHLRRRPHAERRQTPPTRSRAYMAAAAWRIPQPDRDDRFPQEPPNSRRAGVWADLRARLSTAP